MRTAAMLAALSVGPLLAEAGLSARHDAALRAGGAVEPEDDVYAVMQAAYPACFLAICAEAALRDRPPGPVTAAGVTTFVAAKALKYWAIGTLGGRWTFRVLVPPGSSRIEAGPYRILRHPNYLAVVGELAGLAIAGGARLTGPLAIAGFGLLLRRRIHVEDRALGAAAPPPAVT